MAAGRRIHHDAVVLPSLHPGGDLEQRHQLVQAGQREIQELIDVLIVQKGAGGGDLAQHAAILLTELVQALLSVQFEHLQIAGGRVAGQTVPHRVRGVSGNQQQRTLRRLCGKAQRGRRGAGGLAHSPLAAKQQKLEALLVEKRWHMPVHFAASLHLVRLPPGIVGVFRFVLVRFLYFAGFLSFVFVCVRFFVRVAFLRLPVLRRPAALDLIQPVQ